MVAAKNRPFSIDRKPITCGTAFERVIIIMNESSTQASAMPSVPRAIESESRAIGRARLKAKITSTMPISIVVGMLISVSTSQRTLRRSITRCSSIGIRITLSSEGQRRRQVEVRLVGHVADHRGRGHERQALQREQVDQRQDPALRDHRERAASGSRPRTG